MVGAKEMVGENDGDADGLFCSVGRTDVGSTDIVGVGVAAEKRAQYNSNCVKRLHSRLGEEVVRAHVFYGQTKNKYLLTCQMKY
jgi:hypothetical protein